MKNYLLGAATVLILNAYGNQILSRLLIFFNQLF